MKSNIIYRAKILKNLSILQFLLIANNSALNASALVNQECSSQAIEGSAVAQQITNEVVQSSTAFTFDRYNLPTTPEIAAEEVRSFISKYDFSEPKRDLNKIIDFLGITAYRASLQRGIVCNDYKLSFLKAVTNLLSEFSVEYINHVPEDYVPLPSQSAEEINDMLLLNWKKWSTYEYLSYKFHAKEAFDALKEAIEKKCETYEDLNEDDLNGKTEIYRRQIEFVRTYFLENRSTFAGVLLESNCDLIYTGSAVY
jgi:hypothetical protein